MVIWLGPLVVSLGEIRRRRRHAELHPCGPVDAAGQGHLHLGAKVVLAKVDGADYRQYRPFNISDFL